MKILITGATGFLGAKIIEDLLGKGFKIIITKRASSDMRELTRKFGALDAWDIERQGIENIFIVHPDIDAIVHAATDYGRDEARPTTTFWANEVFPMKLLEFAMQYKVRLFINIDTFFNSKNVEYDYLQSYTLSKRHFQEWGYRCASSKTITFVNFRLFHLYGPGDRLNKFTTSMIGRCMTGEEIDLSDGEQRRDFIHVDDAVSAIRFILEAKHDCGYRHFDVGTGISTRIRDFMELARTISGGGAKLNFGALPIRDGELRDARADTTALRTLGWQPQVGLEAGIQSIVDDIDVRKRR